MLYAKNGAVMSLIQIQDNDGEGIVGNVGAVLVNRNSVVVGVAPMIGWTDEDVLHHGLALGFLIEK